MTLESAGVERSRRLTGSSVDGIRVHSVYTAYVWTPIVEEVPGESSFVTGSELVIDGGCTAR